MSIDGLKQEYLPKYLANGDDKFYRSLLVLAVTKLLLLQQGTYKKDPAPHLEYLDYAEWFLVLYRREGDDTYLKIAKMLRKAAHKIYRVMLKKNLTTPNVRFLNLVKTCQLSTSQ